MPTSYQRPWLEPFIKECEQFPNGSYDDQVDALSIVLDVLARTPIGNAADFSVDQLATEDSLLKQIQSYRGYTDDPFSNGIDRRIKKNVFSEELYSNALGE